MGKQGIDSLVLIRMDHQAGPLVQQQDMLILIQDIQLRLVQGQKSVFRGGAVKELVVDI